MIESSLPSSQEGFASIWDGLELACSPTPEFFPLSDTCPVIDDPNGHIEPAIKLLPAPDSPQLLAKKFINPFEDLDDTDLAFFTAPESEIGQNSSPATISRHFSPDAIFVDFESELAGSATTTVVHRSIEPSFIHLDELDYFTQVCHFESDMQMMDSTNADRNNTKSPLSALNECVDISEDEEPGSTLR